MYDVLALKVPRYYSARIKFITFGAYTPNALKRLLTFITMLALVLSMEGCASHHSKKHKKLRPGKPIPCPLKDC